MLQAYKYRIYPDDKQEELIQKTFGCCRFVYNTVLDYRQKLYKEQNKGMSKIDCNNYVNRVLKKEYEWLKEPDKNALTNAVYNMDSAYQKFFKEHTGFPRFKSKRNNYKSYKTNWTNNNIEVGDGEVKLPKLKWVKASTHRIFKGKIKSATISQLPNNKYYCSVLVETEIDKLPQNNSAIGIDLGVKDLVITSNGKKFDNIKTTKKYEKKLAKEQRKLAHKQKGSNNWNKQRVKIARIHEKIANIRKDNLHKISHKLINENQVVVSENLKVSEMVKDRKLAKSIIDCGWYELTRQLEYKAKWYGRTYMKVDRYFPSSQLCSYCGHQVLEIKKLSIREWTCPVCGKKHDRDINAAINIREEGLRMLNTA